MAAPHKRGLDYFPHDCNLDHKIDIVEARFGLTGYGVYFKLLEVIYAQGEALNVNEDFWLVFFAKKCQIDYDKGLEIVKFLVQKNLFDSKEFEKGVLTNSGIKKRFAEATKRRKPLTVENNANSEINVSNNDINVNINQVNADINPQSKVKESKVNSSSTSIAKVENFEEKKQPKIESQSGISLKNFTAQNLEYQLKIKDSTKTSFELWRRNHKDDYLQVLENFIAHQTLMLKEYTSFEKVMSHLQNYHFIKEAPKEKNFVQKENFKTNGNSKFSSKDDRRSARLANLASKHNIDIG